MSEGRDAEVVAALRASVSDWLLDTHVDWDHHRSVLTLAGPGPELVAAILRLAGVARAAVDLRAHEGVHPRFGALDVVPFAPLLGEDLAAAVAAREAAIEGLAAEGLPCFRYGPIPGGTDRELPEVRRRAFRGLDPDAGPARAHPTAGAVAVGARRPLVAWNAWIQGASSAEVRGVAAQVRGEGVRALGLVVTGATQVSCNLVAPTTVTPRDVYRRIEAALPPGAHVVRCELVGLLPEAVLAAVPQADWASLDLSEDRAIERRAAARGLA